MKIEPLTLSRTFIRFEPLKSEHFDALCKVGLADELRRLIPEQITQPAAMKKNIEKAIDEQNGASALPFSTIENSSHTVVGSTRFANVDAKNLRTEIGWTWINRSWQVTYVNTEVKILGLAHAFETRNCIRVELKTDALNQKSRHAILRNGAKQEGSFRRHIICQSGRLRDPVYFSILDNEWQKAKENLMRKLGRI